MSNERAVNSYNQSRQRGGDTRVAVAHGQLDCVSVAQRLSDSLPESSAVH